ncbi:hypothetical protein GCM10027445_32270 [Amycolatopsis endophytica]|uniref:Uncharacterized protein n=1 Tax=Amycolatopsis endophytica TaxID=860233 RepID=A0A853B258_9PSEU|nr:hypothetical protein [Amycolatopsis endophytica]NYI88851.1 hypothetical protein [Amycolatopsis endophytica]
MLTGLSALFLIVRIIEVADRPLGCACRFSYSCRTCFGRTSCLGSTGHPDRSMIRLLLADDQALIRGALASMLRMTWHNHRAASGVVVAGQPVS